MVRDHVSANARESGGDGGQDLAGVGMHASDSLDHFGGRMLRIDQRGGLLEFVAQPRHLLDADLFELIERGVDHVGVVEHPPIRVGADRIVARRLRHQVVLEPLRIIINRRDQVCVGLGERLFVRTVGDLGEGERDVVLEKSDRRRHLLQRDIDIDLRRQLRLQIAPRRVEIAERG